MYIYTSATELSSIHSFCSYRGTRQTSTGYLSDSLRGGGLIRSTLLIKWHSSLPIFSLTEHIK